MNLTKELLAIFFGMIFVSNFVFTRTLGLCPYLGVSRHFKPALGMGMAVIFVITMTGIVTWIVYAYVLIPLHIEYLYNIVFILIIATLVQLVEMVLAKYVPFLHQNLGIYLPLITTNCAVLGIAVYNINSYFIGSTPVANSFIKCVVSAVGCSAGFCVALLLMSGIRERLDLGDLPDALKEIPVAFITAALMSIAFMGFL